MSQLVTVESLIEKVRLAADQQGSSQRTDDADIIMLLEDAYGRYVGQASGEGWPYFLSYSEVELTVGRSASTGSDFPFGLTTLATGDDRVEGVYRFEVRLPGGEWRNVEPVEFHHANMFQAAYNPTQNGVPRQYWMHAGSGEDLNGNIQQLAFIPPADITYTARIWYAPVRTFPSTSTEVEVGVVGGEWWMIWDTVEILSIRDHYPEQAQMAAQKRLQCWQELLKRVGSRNKQSNFRVRDTRGMRRIAGSRRWFTQ